MGDLEEVGVCQLGAGMSGTPTLMDHPNISCASLSAFLPPLFSPVPLPQNGYKPIPYLWCDEAGAPPKSCGKEAEDEDGPQAGVLQF